MPHGTNRIGAMLLAASACSTTLPSPRYASHSTDALMEVGFPPPPARVEYIPPSPHEDAVWIDGEWAWRGDRWAWTYGRWVLAPSGATFSPWTSVHSLGGTLYFAPGAWRDEKG